jgi:uncharacterized Zn finger protein (UPF0148 family)
MEGKGKEDKNAEIERKLSELLTIGWTLLDEKCPLESCDCPLLKSFDGNKYCVNCEMWQFPDQVKARQKYTDLVVKSNQELILRETGLKKLYKNRINFNIYSKESALHSLKTKLAYLSSVLNQNKDLSKTHQILQNIELCLKNIKTINESL